MAYQLLLVEDDPKIREVIGNYLERKSNHQWEITYAIDGAQAEEAIYEQEYDLALLDIMIPKGDGFSLCRMIRAKGDTPIIFITARGGEEDTIYGYDLGCDDYIVKPFSIAVLYAKINALLKRSKGMLHNETLEAGNICMNPYKMLVTVEGEPVDLAPKLYLLLKYLMEHKGVVIAREDLLVRIWGYDFEGTDRVVDNHIKKLRKALGTCGSQIKTVFGKGYRLEG